MNQLIAQILTHILGFLLFFWILKRYAWGPVCAQLDQRRKRVRDEFDRIEAGRREVEEMRRRYEALLESIEEERRERVNAGIEEGRRIAQEITDHARSEARQMAQKAERAIQMEVDKARIELKDRMVEITIKAAEKLLRERLDAPRHREFVRRFVEELEARKA